MKAGKFKDILITSLIKVCGYSAIIFVGMIFVFLIKEGSPALIRVPLENFLQLRWYPIEDRFGLLPLIGGSLIVTIGAAIFSIPLGLVSAVYIAEVAPRWAREILKPLVEVLGGLHILPEKNSLETWEEMTQVCHSPNPLTDVTAINKTVLNATI